MLFDHRKHTASCFRPLTFSTLSLRGFLHWELQYHPSGTCSYCIWSYNPYNAASVRHSTNIHFLPPFLDVLMLSFSILKMGTAIPTSVGHCDSARREAHFGHHPPPPPQHGN